MNEVIDRRRQCVALYSLYMFLSVTFVYVRGLKKKSVEEKGRMAGGMRRAAQTILALVFGINCRSNRPNS